MKSIERCLRRPILMLLALLLATSSAKAQSIRADASRLTTVNHTNPTVGGETFVIEDGRAAGDNLFHSFEAFSIPQGGTVTFKSTSAVLNIISRVTGNSASLLEGRLQSQTPVDFFLINPNGIVLGPDAALKIGGSFIGSTAESILFPNEQRFVAADVSENPLLSISAPIGLQMSPTSSQIQVNGDGYRLLAATPLTIDSSSSLRLDGGHTLALVGNGISFDGGNIAVPGGQIALGSVGEGVVKLGDGWIPDYTEVSDFADISMEARSLIHTSNGLFNSQGHLTPLGVRSRNIYLQSRNFSATDSSLAIIQNFIPLSSGSIYVNASEGITLSDADENRLVGSGFTTATFDTSEKGSGSGGNILIDTPQLLLTGDGFITTETFGTASSGNIRLLQRDSAITMRERGILPNTLGGIHTISYAPGRAGDVSVLTGTLKLWEDGISSQAIRTGNSGNLTVVADSIEINNGSTISSTTLNEGNSGDVIVTADDIAIVGTNPFTFLPSAILATSVANGDAGNLTINTQRLLVLAGGRVDSSTISRGDAGTVTVNADESIQVSGTVPGSINPSLIVSSATVVDPEVEAFLATRGVTDLPAVPEGAAGSVTINTPHLSVSDGAQVTVRNDGTGNAGTLTANVHSLHISQGAGITASTLEGSGGGIEVYATESVVLRQGGQLSAEARGEGNGGNITLGSPVLVAVENSDIIANAEQGSGGEIRITTQGIFGTEFREQLTPESDITASSEFGVSGVVNIENTATAPESGLVELPNTVVDPDSQVVAGCSGSQLSQFVASGRGGLPIGPVQTVVNNRVWRDVRSVDLPTEGLRDRTTSIHTSSRTLPTSAETTLSEATRWEKNEQGAVILTIGHTPTHTTTELACLSQSLSQN